ncbi:MAG: hypothetical protein CMP91_03785 [Gammaproteobacteria bacterium]|nr:hypothetical protein [Gammaproteobacteria bacterium]MAY01812.1 hypothetical protein [Gammaproteobacteria bacterium]|tara:strand:+ start:1391 stop:1969 length:579 start_codon:yes stop_codon:yes gene_type:complete
MQKLKIKKALIKILIIYLSAIFPSFALAHHAPAEFTNTRIELEGTLLQVSWRNPHPGLNIQLSDTGAMWTVQIPETIRSLTENSITASTFEIGQTIKIVGFTSRQNENFLQGTHVLLPDGQELILQAGLQNFRSQTAESINNITITNGAISEEARPDLSAPIKIFIIFSLFVCLLSMAYFRSHKNRRLQVSG